MALVGTINPGNYLTFKNRIQNGDFKIWQRGTPVTGVGVDGRSVDRHFQWAGAGGQVGRTTWSQETSDLPVGFGSGLNISVTTAHTSIGSTEAYALNTRLEGQDFQDLQWGTANAKSFTVSFWAKSNKTGTYCLWINHTSASTKYNIREVPITNTWTYFSYTFSGDPAMAVTNDTAGRISVYLGLMGGSSVKVGTAGDAWNTGNGMTTNQVNFFDSTSNVLRITGLQLEVGSVATPFENRPYGVELQLCQRYYQYPGYMFQCGQAYGTGVDGFTVNYPFAVAMRAAPTSTVVGGSDGGSLAQLVVSSINTNKCTFEVRNTSGGGTSKWYTWYQYFNAEI
jgi:hypothetical protein